LIKKQNRLLIVRIRRLFGVDEKFSGVYRMAAGCSHCGLTSCGKQ
jgi:hypothetical protein